MPPHAHTMSLLQLPPELLERISAALRLKAYGRFAQASHACKVAVERTPHTVVVTAEVAWRLKTGDIQHREETIFSAGDGENSLDGLCSYCPELVLPARQTLSNMEFRFCRNLIYRHAVLSWSSHCR